MSTREQLLTEAEAARQHVTNILERISDAFVALDTEWRYTYVNAKAAHIFGRQREDLVGKHIWTEFPEAIGQPFYKAYYKAVETQQPMYLEEYDPPSNRWFESRIYPSQEGLSIFFQDITERKRVKEVLRENEEWFRHLSAAAFEAIIIHEGGVLLGANDQYYEMFGYEPEELLGKQALLLTVAPEAIESMRKEIATGGLGPYESIGLKKDGTRFPMEIRVREMEYEGRKVRVAAIMDITERKRAEEALRESEEKFRTIFESVPLSMIVIDKDGIMVEVNPHQVYHTARGLTSREDYIGKSLITHPTIVNAGLSDTYRRLLTGESFDLKDVYFPSIQRGTEGYYFNIKGVPLFKEGEVIGAITVHEDITERKRAEEMLQRYNQRLMILHDIDRDIAMARSLRAIVDTVLKHIRRLIPCWRANVILYEPDTDEIVVLASEANGETAVQPGMRFPAPAGWANRMLTEHYNIVEDTHTLPEPISPVVRLAIANGTRSFISTSLLAEGNLIGALALGRRTPAAFAAEDIEIASDVANQLAIAIHQARLKEQIERYAAELEEKVAQRTAELRDINAELETFAYSVSHDLKAPLRGIDGYGRLLLQDYADKLDEDGRTFLYTIRSATQQMNQLIDDLLTYSRLERRAMTTGSLNPRLLVEMLIAERADELNARQVTPSVDIPCGTVTAEAEGLVEALRNLLENALKFTRDVPAPRIEIGGRETDKTCILWVRDNGIGFDMQYHDRIFEIFQRLHRAEDYPGTGIGLAIVRKVMQRMGGRVWAESTPGQGATFFLEVPK
jgi:PAS domain S-box-containing protein